MQHFLGAYQKSQIFSNSMKVLRAIGKGDINVATSQDLMTISNLEEDRRRVMGSNTLLSLNRGTSPIDDLSYVQFFNELVYENSKIRSKRNSADPSKLPEIKSITPNKQLSEMKGNRKSLILNRNLNK